MKNPETPPKFPKVWAWDDDINEAFETYLIAEFEGMEEGCNYLCVSPGDLNRFEKKQWFRTEFYKNSSNTDPRQIKEIEEFITKYVKETILKYINK